MLLLALAAKVHPRAGLEPIRPSGSPAGAKVALATSLAIGSAGLHHLMAGPQFAALALVGRVLFVNSLVRFRKALGSMA